jgi:BTB/POZ domain-containing protein KCTD9
MRRIYSRGSRRRLQTDEGSSPSLTVEQNIVADSIDNVDNPPRRQRGPDPQAISSGDVGSKINEEEVVQDRVIRDSSSDSEGEQTFGSHRSNMGSRQGWQDEGMKSGDDDNLYQYRRDDEVIDEVPSRTWSPESFLDFVMNDQKIIRFNVGGVEFSTSRETISNDRGSMLSIMLRHEEMQGTKDQNGAFFIDRDPAYFRYVLNFLRDGSVDLPEDRHDLSQLLREGEFYQVEGLCKAIRKHRRRRARISRESFLLMINTRGSTGLMFPNTDFSGEDLSHMSITKGCFINADLSDSDLRFSDFEKTRFSGALFRSANLSNASFTEAKMDGVDLTGANLQKAQLYKCDLKNACLCKADLMRANLQEANLTGTDLRGSNLQGVILHGADLRGFNLESSNLQGANLECADLRGAILRNANMKGANLWDCNLSGADLDQTNLRDANLHRANMSNVRGEYLR